MEALTPPPPPPSSSSSSSLSIRGLSITVYHSTLTSTTASVSSHFIANLLQSFPKPELRSEHVSEGFVDRYDQRRSTNERAPTKERSETSPILNWIINWVALRSNRFTLRFHGEQRSARRSDERRACVLLVGAFLSLVIGFPAVGSKLDNLHVELSSEPLFIPCYAILTHRHLIRSSST